MRPAIPAAGAMVVLDPDRVWAIVPVKLLPAAKSRLATALGPQERLALVLGMLEHVLNALAAARRVGHWAVVSPDARVLSMARGRGGLAIEDPGLDLNEALALGVAAAEEARAEAVLVLPADLPLLRGRELDRLVERAQEGPCAVIARAGRDGGTNALMLRPPRALRPAFGLNSFEAHRRQAREAGIPLYTFEAPGLALDLDTPEFLTALPPGRLAQWIERYGAEAAHREA